jgi:hypothetical protein
MNMKSKYLVLATTLLLALSSTSVATAATHGVLFPPAAVDSHGPRIGAIDFSVIASDPSLAGSLATGAIQAPEWTFTAGSFESLAASANVLTGKTEGYTFEGIVFNSIHPVIGNVLFREAIQLLTVYTGPVSIATTILSGNLAGVATADVMPCNLYAVPVSTSVCAADQKADGITPDQIHPSFWTSNQIADDQLAAEDLASIPQIVAQFNGANITAATIAGWSLAAAKTNLPSLTYVNATYPHNVFDPNLQYRSDDPLRSGAAVLLVSYASDIGLSINAQGITDAEADTIVYGNAIDPLVSNGVYCTSNTNSTGTFPGNQGTDNCPSPVISVTPSILASDPWDMYTYGWVASSNFEFQAGEWMNSQFLSDEINTGYVLNTHAVSSPSAEQSCDFYENGVLYNQTLPGAEHAAIESEKCSAQNLPDIVMFYESYLFGNYINGWTGYANLPSCGANSVTCAYYTMLNAHPTVTGTSLPVGGTLSYAVHGAPAAGGLNPIYGTNWVWQADLWSEFYDSPLATPPTALTVPGAWMPYMLSGETTPVSTYGPTSDAKVYGTAPFGNSQGGVQVAAFTLAKTGVGSGISDIPANAFCIQNTTTFCDLTIPNGEAITYTFNNNMTWSDGVPITALDYNYSLWALDVAGTPALANAADYTPFAFADSGPFGLLATTVNVAQNSITMYMGDQAFWNIIAVNVDFLPMHEFQNLNIYNAFAYHTSVDLSGTAASQCAFNSAYFSVACGSLPTYLTSLANLEVSSGPFELTYYSYATNPNAGVMTANLNYYRTAWWDALVPNEVGPSGTITFNVTPQLLSAEPSTYIAMDSAGGASGFTCTATIQEYTGAIPAPTTNKYVGIPTGAAVSATAAVTGCGTSATISIPVSIAALHLATGKNYKVSFEMTYTYLGLSRVWYQYFGFNVASSGPSSVTGTPTS